ncbi:hypothetical protein EV421DRAFT_1972353 [Armillaria borealis]|uniref:Uncharacterized protein n=1 Tax=Armillaria borealis TaxID=47425 RepID=A0AA39JAW0_9AGAR|nr:hypothetical protein EV421DRAFT_1972353 [Armillaria borealis]
MTTARSGSAARSPPRYPVVTGHVYCLKCIPDHISSSSPDGFTASCPTCRTEFPIVLPEVSASSFRVSVFSSLPQLHSLPNKFHRYVTPSIRRVFIEPETFKQRLDALEARITILERDNGVLVAAVAKEKNDLQKMKHLEMETKKTCVCDDTRCLPQSAFNQTTTLRPDAYLRLQLRRALLQILVKNLARDVHDANAVA